MALSFFYPTPHEKNLANHGLSTPRDVTPSFIGRAAAKGLMKKGHRPSKPSKRRRQARITVSIQNSLQVKGTVFQLALTVKAYIGRGENT